MEEKNDIIARLREENRKLNKDIHLAATYGKQLFEEKAQLSSKIDDLFKQKEALEQEKHVLQLDLETKIQALNSETNEVEYQKEKLLAVSENLRKSDKDAELLKKKYENLLKENQDLKKVQEDLSVENQSLLKKINLLENQIKKFEEQVEKSMCEAEFDVQDIQAQLNVYMNNNKDLQVALSQTQCELEMAKKNENHLLEMVRDLEETVKEKSSDISTYHAEARKAKEDIEELQAEIEVLKFDQIDVNRRGNSVFAELDDRRHLVEREYKTLRKKYDLLKKDYDENMKEVDKLRGQTAILQSMTSRSYEQAYIDQLEDSLSSSRREIKDLMHKLSKAVKDSDNSICLDKAYCQKRGYDYLRLLLEQSRQRVKELENENTSLLTQSMYDNDKVIKTQQLLYKSKEDLDSASQEIVQLKLKIKELEQGIMHSLPTVKQPAKPRIEYLEGFKPLDNGKENELLNKSKLDPFADLDIIPGEIELFEDGFKETRRPRKSNRFKLQEFNRIKSDDEETVSEPTSSVAYKKTESIVESSAKEKTCHETETEKPKVRSYPKTAPRRRDECKQQ